jgi:hypothetical protein
MNSLLQRGLAATAATFVAPFILNAGEVKSEQLSRIPETSPQNSALVQDSRLGSRLLAKPVLLTQENVAQTPREALLPTGNGGNQTTTGNQATTNGNPPLSSAESAQIYLDANREVIEGAQNLSDKVVKLRGSVPGSSPTNTSK